jgi:hypothetical protein
VHIDMKQIRMAWVPDDVPDRPWEDAAELGIDWIIKQAADLGVKPLLVSNTLQGGRGIRRLDALADAYGRGAPTASSSYELNRAVLAFVPSAGILAFAQVHAQRAALCVVETKSTPLAEWAAAVSAEDLTRPGQTAESTLDPKLREALDFTFGFGERTALRARTRRSTLGERSTTSAPGASPIWMRSSPSCSARGFPTTASRTSGRSSSSSTADV